MNHVKRLVYHDEMNASPRRDPRANQKERTRAALVDAARRLLSAGTPPTVADAAEAARVSRATAYRYFPTQDALFVELTKVGPAVAPVERALAAMTSPDAEVRLLQLLDAFNPVVFREETTMRTALPCLVTVVLTAVIPLAVGVALLRGMALDAARTAALALSAAATGLFALHWHCTDGSASHLMAYHAFPWLALALLAIPLRRALPTESHVP